jgi:eukaryotic-like serine/threonine-protein kinase
VVQLYAAAQEAASNGKFEDALDSASKAVRLDPNFGVGYQLLSVASRNVGRLQDADRYIREALQHLNGMTERERLTTRGFYYRVTGDYQNCVKEYGDLITRYAADVVGHNQLALCASKLRDLQRSVNEMRQVVSLLPKRAIFRENLALYADYAGDFQTGEREARAVQDPDAYARIAMAFAQTGQDHVADARATYDSLRSMETFGASTSASGLGDLALYEGRFSDGIRILNQGAVADLAAKNPDRAAAKFIAVAYAHLLRGENAAAVAADEKALARSQAVKIRFVAARTFAEAGSPNKSGPIVAGLASELYAEPQAYAKIVQGDVALQNGDARQAIKLFSDANSLLDTWIGHFDLGRAYLQAGALPQADSEFDRCFKRRGEALSLFLDEEPTAAYLPPVYYYQGRVREGMKIDGFAAPYRTYLAIRGQSSEDPLLPDVRRRAGR